MEPRNGNKSVPRTAPRTEVPGLTGLRFIAAFSVVIAHGAQSIIKLAGSSYGPIYWLEEMAALGMGLFFVLSGFVIHYNYRTVVTQGGLNGLAGFVWARFARLYPLFICVLAVDIILGRKLFDYMAGNNYDFLEVLRALPYYLTFTQSWFYVPFANNSLVYVVGLNSALTWSISTEWFFYLAYPLVAWVVLWACRPVITMGAAAAWSIFWIVSVSALSHRLPQIDGWAASRFGSIASATDAYQDSFIRWLMTFSPYLRIGEFIMGCLAAQLFLQLQSKKPTHREQLAGGILLLAGLLSVAALIYLIYSPNERVMFNGQLMFIDLGRSFWLAPSVAVIVFCVARYDTFLSAFINSRPFVALGEASYSIYMVHFLIFVLAGSFLGDVLPVTAPNVAFIVGRYVFLVALILVISLGLHAFIEVPTRQSLRNLWHKRPERRQIVAYLLLASPGIAAVLVLLITPVDSTASVTSGVRLITASYGANCDAQRGNATKSLSKTCNGRNSCQYIVDVTKLGDPAPGCAKNFTVEYQCAPSEIRYRKDLPSEAGLGSRLDLSCTSDGATDAPATAAIGVPVSSPATASADYDQAGGIRVRNATYGGNCGAASGNATQDLGSNCNGKTACAYSVDVGHLGDPAPKCGKDFVASYSCFPDTMILRKNLPAEAGFGSVLNLRCEAPDGQPTKQ
jgi:peptidoglycan/LPS O-acetylase OafA/YrhL